MKNLIKLRKERGLTNEELGNILGVSKSRYNNWEIERAEPNIEFLIKLADFFCVSIDYLVGHHASTPAPMGESLDTEEKELIKYYRGMSNVSKNAIMVTAESFYKNNVSSNDTKIG